MDSLRVSCGGLCRIEIDGKFLLEINKNRGDVLTPIGGALEFHEEARPFFERLGAVFEKGNDLRLFVPTASVPAFEAWFRQRVGRETDPLRELQEELIAEHHVVSEWPDMPPEITYRGMKSREDPTGRKGLEGVLTRYYFEVFDVGLPAAIVRAVRPQVAGGVGRLRLVSRGEIDARKSGDAIPISLTAAMLLEVPRVPA